VVMERWDDARGGVAVSGKSKDVERGKREQVLRFSAMGKLDTQVVFVYGNVGAGFVLASAGQVG
jgi:hypothetical protein